jgi:hypothetical protein
MSVTLSFHHFASERPDVHMPLHIPMVYENVQPARPQWEYRTLTVDTREQELPDVAQLNEWGNEGWLLVGMLDQRIRGEHGPIHYYFVRHNME